MVDDDGTGRLRRAWIRKSGNLVYLVVRPWRPRGVRNVPEPRLPDARAMQLYAGIRHSRCAGQRGYPSASAVTGRQDNNRARMSSTNLSSFIWSVADLLRGDYKQSDYGKVILPFTVLRRLDCVLEPTKQAVLDEFAARAKAGLNPGPFLLRKSGQHFYWT